MDNEQYEQLLTSLYYVYCYPIHVRRLIEEEAVLPNC